jgi:hypothetical protein
MGLNMKYAYNIRKHIRSAERRELIEWCNSQLGEYQIYWTYKPNTGNIRIRFKKHYTWFILRWS